MNQIAHVHGYQNRNREDSEALKTWHAQIHCLSSMKITRNKLVQGEYSSHWQLHRALVVQSRRLLVVHRDPGHQPHKACDVITNCGK